MAKYAYIATGNQQVAVHAGRLLSVIITGGAVQLFDVVCADPDTPVEAVAAVQIASIAAGNETIAVPLDVMFKDGLYVTSPGSGSSYHPTVIYE